MNPQEILAKIAKLKSAIQSESDPDVKATYQKKVAALEIQIAEAEKKVEQKEEKAAIEEKKELSEAEQKISKLKAAIATESDPDVKQRYQKKIDSLQGTLKEVKEEIKEEKKEIAEQKKEIKEAIKEVKTAVKTIGQTEKKSDDSVIKAKIAKLKDAIASESDPDVKATYQKKIAALEATLAESKKEVRKTAIKKDAVKKVAPTTPLPARKAKRKSKLKSIISDLDSLIAKNAKLKSKYTSDYKGTGKPKDLKRDAARSAKPFGYRFVGKHDYRVPTQQQIRKGLKRGTIDYEARPNRSDVFPKKTVKLADGGKLATGGKVSGQLMKMLDAGFEFVIYLDVPKTYGQYHILIKKEKGNIAYILKKGHDVSDSKKVKSFTNEKDAIDYLSNTLGVKVTKSKDDYADGGMMAKGGKTKDEPKVIRGYSDDEAYEYKKGGLAKGTKLDAGVYRVGKPTKVSPILYEQKIVEIFENGDISTASDYGRKLNDFKSQKYPIISKEQLDAQYKLADGGVMAKGGVASYKTHKIGDFVEVWQPMGKKTELKEIIGFEDDKKTYILEDRKGNKSYTPKKYIANMSGDFPMLDEFKKGGTVKKKVGFSEEDKARYAKPAGWRWKEEALTKKIIERKQLSMSPSKKMRDKYPDLVYYEDRLNKADKNPKRTSADSI